MEREVLRRYVRMVGLVTVAAATLAVAWGGRPLLPTLVAAVLLVFLPLTSLAQTAADLDVAAHRRDFYLSTAMLLWIIGGVAWWASRGIGGAHAWFFAPRSPGRVMLEAVVLCVVCLALVWAFHLVAPRFGWRERPLVRDLMPVTPPEKRVYAVLCLAAGTGEELAFRGFLPAFLLPWAGSYMAAALLPTLAFGLMHAYQGAHGIARTTLMGLVLAGGVAWSGSLWSAMVAHTVLDLVLGLVLHDYLLNGSGDET